MADLGFATALAASNPEEILRLEATAGQNPRFEGVDRFAAGLLGAALTGTKIAEIAVGPPGQKNRDVLTLAAAAVSDRSFADDTFALPAQQARGAWFLPEQASLKAATMNLPAYLRRYPRHAMTVATEDVARVHLASNPDALASWALLVPLFDQVLAPVTARAAGSTRTAAEQRTAWTGVLDAYRNLGVQVDSAVSLFDYGGGWAELDRVGQAEARTALLDSLAGNDLHQLVRRFRGGRVHALVAAIVKKSRHGTPLARQVLTKPLQPVLAAYFGGDWLAFLDYLGTKPNPNEEVVTRLPEPKLYVGGSAQAASVATERGLDVDEVHAMLAAFLGQSVSVSPVEQRVEVLDRWWTQFDALHARQTPGTTPLWGLVEDVPYFPLRSGAGPAPQLYRRLLAADLVDDVDRLWNAVTLPRWPDRIVSEPYPHKLMAETFGPAVALWHGVGLTAWYVCEGPYSRTTVAELRAYYARDLTALAEAGTPVDTRLFDDLEQAENRLGSPQRVENTVRTSQTRERASLKIDEVSYRRDGFEALRDVVTRHRRHWAQQHLVDYLRHRWTRDLTTVARELHRHVAAKDASPTFREFARFAAPTANRWFNGDLAGLYNAIGEKTPVVPVRAGLRPVEARPFIDAVYVALGGRVDYEYADLDGHAGEHFGALAKLAAASVYYLQLSEALGRPPAPQEFRAKRYQWDWVSSFTEGWATYQRAIERTPR